MGFSRVYDINDCGQILGVSQNSRLVIWQPGKGFKDLGPSKYPGGRAITWGCLNNKGEAVGTLVTTAGHRFGWMCTPKKGMVDFEPCLLGINDCGRVVGGPLEYGYDSAFVWSKGYYRYLGTLGGLESSANAINNADTVVGTADLPGGERHGFHWKKSQGMLDVNDLIYGYTDYMVTDCLKVSEKGWILAYGSKPDRLDCALLLIPHNSAKPKTSTASGLTLPP